MSELETKLGLCVICGSRVFGHERYLKATEGYCHRNCVEEATVFA